MKTAVIIFALFVVGISGENEIMKLAKEVFLKCSETMKPSAEVLNNLKTGTGQDHKETNCMRACVMKESGLWKDGKLDTAKVGEIFEKGYIAKHIPGAKEVTIAVMKGCFKAGESGADECDKAGKISKCFKEIADKIKAVFLEAAAKGA